MKLKLTRKQLRAIHLETGYGDIVIEQVKPGNYTHTYVTDNKLRKEFRCLHIAKNGNVMVCERSVTV